MQTVINVHVAFDEEARVWYVTKSDIHGLRVEAPKFEEMIERVQSALLDLLEDDGEDGCCEVPVEVIAHHHASLRRAAH